MSLFIIRTIIVILVTLFGTEAYAKVYHEANLTKWYINENAKVIKTSVYDTENYDRYLAFRVEKFIGKPSKYDELINALDKANASDKVYIYFVNNRGGYASSADIIIKAMDRSLAEVVVVIQGSAMSAAANITCAADKIYMTQGSVISFHLSQYMLESVQDQQDLEASAQIHYKSSKDYWDSRCMKRGLIDKEQSDKAYNDGKRLAPTDVKPFVHIKEETVRNRIPSAYREGGFE